MNKNHYIIASFLMVGLNWSQSATQLRNNQSDQLRQSMLREKLDQQEQRAQDQYSVDELMRLEELYDSTNVPVKIIVTPSEIEEYYRLKLGRIKEDIIGLNVIESLLDTVGQMKYFGYDYFYNFEQRELWERTIPPDHYELSPGDEIIIAIWGQTERREKKIIGRDGTVFINDIGLISLGGKTISDAQEYVKKELSAVYETILGTDPKTFVNITHGKISGKTVSFTGHVKAPGMHVVTPYVDPITALIYAGGVDTTGSLRNMVHYRNGSIIDTLDLYDYLLDGSPVFKKFIQNGDRLHIPRRLETITVSGDVLRPAHYELKSNETLMKAVRLSGGTKNKGKSLIHLNRFEKNGTPFNQYFHLSELTTLFAIDGDSLSIFQYRVPLSHIFVYGVNGKPIKLPYAQNLSLKDIVLMVTDYGRVPNFKWSEKINYESMNGSKEYYLSTIIEDEIEIKLNPNDRITFLKNPDYNKPGLIKLAGAVNNTGVLPVDRHGQTLQSIINLAGGLRENALKDGIQIYRDSLRLGWQNNSMLILPGDSINVLYDQGTIEILGEVNAPGIYEVGSSSVSVKKALAMAGGLSSKGSKNKMFIIYSNGMVKEAGGFFGPSLSSGSTLVVSEKGSEEYRTTLETTEKLAGIVGSLATLLLVINSTTSTGN